MRAVRNALALSRRQASEIRKPEPRFTEERWLGLSHEKQNPGRLRVLDSEMHAELFAEGGPIALHPDDRRKGALVAGVTGVGKTSFLLRFFANDLRDRNAAQILLDPKPELVERCLELTGPDRGKEVWYLDLGDPAFGMNPLRMYRDQPFATEAAAVADSVVQALVGMFEGQLYQSSKRYLYPAVIGALAIATCHSRMRDGLLEHVYALLRPQEAGMRQVAALCCTRLGLDRTARFFQTELPQDLEVSPQRVADRMDPPANKITKLLDREPLRRFFQHPYDVSIAEIVDRRGILLVNAGRGRIGTENAQACMHFIFQLLDRHMQRLMEIPEEERPRTAVICDEAHYLFSRSVIKQIATHRAAGMDMTAGIQYMSQLGAEAETAAATAEIRDGVAHLLQSKFLFRITEPNGADREVRPAMAVVTTMTQQDPDSRIQRRVTPEVMMNIEDYYCVASQIIAGGRAPAYIGRTYPMQTVSRAWAELHLERMRERVGPKPEGFVRSVSELVDADALMDQIGASAQETETAGGEGRADARTCPRCGKQAVVKRPPRYGGGWVCWKKLDGCGERFEREPDQPQPDAEETGTRQQAEDTAARDRAQQAEETSATGTDSEDEASGEDAGHAGGTSSAAGSSSLPYGPVHVQRAYGKIDASAGDRRLDSRVLAVFGRPPRPQAERPRGEAPGSLRELTLADRLLGLGDWQEQRPDKEAAKLADVEVAILKLLDRGGVLLAPTIARACMEDKADRTVRHRLGKLYEAGLVARAEIEVRERQRNEGVLPFAYRLTVHGFRAAQARGGIDPARDWRPVDIGERAITVPHDQHAIAWVTRLARLLGDRVVSDNWRTPRSQHGVISPPTVSEGRARRPLAPKDLRPPAPSYGFDGAFAATPAARFAEIKPDAQHRAPRPGP
jgi:DNA-binding transcriptional ArsR family regulator